MHIPNASSESVVSCLEAQLYTEVASWDKNGCPSVYPYIYILPLVSVLAQNSTEMQRFTSAVKREALRLDRIKNADLSGRLNHRGWGVGLFVNASVAVY